MTKPCDKDGEKKINMYDSITSGKTKFQYDTHHKENKWVINNQRFLLNP